MKLFKLLFLLVLIAVFLTACAPAVQGLVGLPDDARNLVLVLVTAGLTWVLIQLSNLIKLDLSGYAPPLAAVLAPIIITVIENYLGLIPPIFDDLVLAVIHFLVLLIGGIGTFVAWSRVKNKQTRQLLS